MRSSVHRLVAAALAVALGAWLSASLPAGGAHARGAAREPAKPKVGECHELTQAQIDGATEPSKPVPCSDRHTSEVVAVPTLPARVKLDSSDAFYAAADKACTKPFGERIARGDYRKLEQTAFGLTFFRPTAAQQRAGAHWIRCDAYLRGVSKPAPLTGHAPYVKRQLTDTIARCLTVHFKIETCQYAHTYRSVYVVKLHTKHPPTQKQAERIAVKQCPRYTGTGRFAYSYTLGERYAAGWRTLDCDKLTTS